jgi:hypothetical protein
MLINCTLQNTSLVTFSNIIDDLQFNIKRNRDTLTITLKRNPNLAYQKLNELAQFVGSHYGIGLQLHFPMPNKISDIDSYGTENISIIVDKLRKVFPVPKETVKQRAIELIGEKAEPKDAYTYEGKEGAKIVLPKGSIEVLPGSMHFWCKIDTRIKAYGDWMIKNVYLPKNS